MDMSIEITLLHHLARYPAMQLQDVYKLIHQAALGSEHALRDLEMARQRLAGEWAGAPEESSAPLLEPLSEETGIVRVHLGPYKAAGGDPASLLQAFVRTAREHPRQPALLESYWAVAVDLATNGKIPFSAAGLLEFFAPLQTQGFPAVHHSPAYVRLYHPAYRVIQKEYLGSQPVPFRANLPL